MTGNTQGLLKRLLALDQYHLMSVFALVELFEYGDTYWEDFNNPNWLGSFIHDILIEVTYGGPQSANADPEFVRERLDSILGYLKNELPAARKFVECYKGVYEDPEQSDSTGSKAKAPAA